MKLLLKKIKLDVFELDIVFSSSRRWVLRLSTAATKFKIRRCTVLHARLTRHGCMLIFGVLKTPYGRTCGRYLPREPRCRYFGTSWHHEWYKPSAVGSMTSLRSCTCRGKCEKYMQIYACYARMAQFVDIRMLCPMMARVFMSANKKTGEVPGLWEGIVPAYLW